MTIYTALITPFKQDLTLDHEGVIHLIQRQCQQHVDGLVALGTTAETPTLTIEEKEWIVQQVHQSALPFMVGCGTNCTKKTLETIDWAHSLGASRALIVSPYYNLPPPAGLMAHFLTIAERSACPIVLYNHPGRTGIRLSPQMVLELAMHPNIVGIKEVTPTFFDTLVTVKRYRPEFLVFAGDDQLSLPAICAGADGVISVAANLIGDLMKRLVTLPLAEAQRLQHRLWPFLQMLTMTTNPIVIKAAMHLQHLPSGPPRLPLVPLDEPDCHRLQEVLQDVLS